MIICVIFSDRCVRTIVKSLPGENRNRPVFGFVTKDLAEVLTEAQTEAVLICAVAKHWRTHGL